MRKSSMAVRSMASITRGMKTLFFIFPVLDTREARYKISDLGNSQFANGRLPMGFHICDTTIDIEHV